MFEVDHINSLNDIPDNISNLLTQLKEIKEDFSLEVKICEKNYRIIIRELSIIKNLNKKRCILVKISENPCLYSIHLFDIKIKNSGTKEKNKIYEIEVEGDNHYKLIAKDIKNLIDGKKGASFSSNYPL